MDNQPERVHLGSAPLPGHAQEIEHEDSPGRAWRELSESGLLWLINATVFHPRGFALALSMDTISGNVTGWDLIGDGTEPWRYADDMAGRFASAEATLASQRARPDTVGTLLPKLAALAARAEPDEQDKGGTNA